MSRIICQYFLIYLLCLTHTYSQERNVVQGKVIVPGGKSEGILIVNLVTEQETKTLENGTFSIAVKEDDLLFFVADYIEFTRKMVEIEEISKNWIEVTIKPKLVEIDEVEIIKYDNLDAVSLGILSKPAKVYTKGQRMLKSSSGVIEGLIGIFNPNIKRSRLRVIEVEKEISKLSQLENMFDDEFYTDNYNLEGSQIKQFQYFVLTKKEVLVNLESRNKFLTSFFMSKYLPEFIENQTAK